MLLGPTGCGKSSLLAALARAAVASRAPVALVRVRLTAREHSDAGAGEDARSAKERMDLTAEQVCAQIGYPPRRSFLDSVHARGVTFAGLRSQAELSVPDSAPRLIRALTMLFSVCEELRNERAAAGASPLQAAPVLLIDEVQDLIKDARLKAMGGADVFEALATLIVSHGVDRLNVRVAVAGSSAELDYAFDKTVARGNRWRHYELEDPEPGVVVAALVAKGYAEPEARAMVALCGTRLRLLSEPLTLGVAGIDAATFLNDSAADGAKAFANVFGKLDAPSAVELARVLDAVSASGASARADGAAPALSRPPPTLRSLPAAVCAMDLAPILYDDGNDRLSFQSTLHSNSWARVRGKYTAARVNAWA